MEYCSREVSGRYNARNRCAIVRVMLAYGTGASSAQLGLFFSVFGAVDASFQIARFQKITEPPPEPSLCASEVLLMRSS